VVLKKIAKFVQAHKKQPTKGPSIPEGRSEANLTPIFLNLEVPGRTPQVGQQREPKGGGLAYTRNGRGEFPRLAKKKK